MDSNFKNFLSSGKTLITDTMAPKSELPKVPKNKIVEHVEVTADPLLNLIKRIKDEKISKMDLIEVFKKIIDQEESKI